MTLGLGSWCHDRDPTLKQDVASDAAWVAAYTGFEIQIDERATLDGADKHRTGAVHDIPTGPGGLQNFSPGPSLKPGDWNDMEITVKKHRYTVSINNKQATDFTNPRNNIVAVTPGLPLKIRGSSVNEDPLSGYLGVQAHTANVGFRNIRIKKL